MVSSYNYNAPSGEEQVRLKSILCVMQCSPKEELRSRTFLPCTKGIIFLFSSKTFHVFYHKE